MAISVKKIIEKVFGKPSPYRLSDMTQEFQQQRAQEQKRQWAEMDRRVQQVGDLRRKNNSYDPH